MTEWAETLQRSPVKESDELCQTYSQRGEALRAKWDTEGQLSDEEYDQLDTSMLVVNCLNTLSDAKYKRQRKRFDDWNTPEELRISTLSAIGRVICDTRTVRIRIESFEIKLSLSKPQMFIEDKARIILTHFKETIPDTLDELEEHTELSIASLQKKIQLYQDQISPEDSLEHELNRHINNTNLRIKELEKTLQITQRIYDIKEYFHIHMRDNLYLDFDFSITESNSRAPRFKSQGPRKWLQTKFEEIFDPYYAGVEGNYRFKLKLIPISRAPNVFLVCVTAPNGHTDMDSLVHVMFNPNKLDIPQAPQDGYSQRQVGEPIYYKVLAKHLVEKRYYGGKQHNSLTKSVFYLIETESDRIIRRRNGLLKGVQIDIISSYRSPYPHQSYKGTE